MIARAALATATARLTAAGIAGAAGDARALLAHAMELPRDRLTLHLNDEMSSGVAERFEVCLERRLAREPVARILGVRAFWGRDFIVTPDVLDPRPETESLIAAALERGVPDGPLLDMGTGSGIIAVTLLAEWRTARAVASDISQAALDVTARNAARHGVDDRLELRRTDWFEGLEDLRGLCGMIVSNPPYVAASEMADLLPEVREHDPTGALTDHGDGLSAYRMLAGQGARWLRPGGWLLSELGWQQGASVYALFTQDKTWERVQVLPDMDGRDRLLVARVRG